MPEIKEGLKRFIDEMPLGYAQMTDEYRQAVCNWEERHYGWHVQPDWIRDTPGVINAFFTAVKAFTVSAEKAST